jgi:predicted nucleic acid-binding protein
MLYIDTCVLLALLTPEGHSAAAAAFLAQASAPLAISGWSITELHSALGLKVRTKALSPSQAEAVLQGFERNLAPGLLVLTLEPQDFRNANACLRGWTTTLRAADALHLAIASGRGAPSAAWTRRLWQRLNSWVWRLNCLGQRKQAEGTVEGQEGRAREIVFPRQPDADRPGLPPAGTPALPPKATHPSGRLRY